MTRRVLSSNDTSGGRAIAADTTEYQYDIKDRIVKIIWRGDGSRNEVTQYTWNDDDYLTQKILPNGITVSYQYDSVGQVKQMEYRNSSSVVIDKIQYKYDEKGQIIQRDALNNIGQDETPFSGVYDAANRLTQLTLNPGTAIQAAYNLNYDQAGYRSGHFGYFSIRCE